MDVKLTPATLGGPVRAIESKSQAHRLLICSALSDSPTIMDCRESSEDIEATKRCLIALGARIENIQDGFEITPISSIADNPVLDCVESGSTLRFLLPLACALGANANFRLHGKLPSRPISPLADQLMAHGCNITGQGAQILSCSGKLKGGKFSLPGDISSQFISGLLFSLPLLGEGSLLRITSAVESGPYIDMTLEAIARFGVEINRSVGDFIIPGGQRYQSLGRVSAEGDWSNAAFWLAAGAVGKKGVTCSNLNVNSKQGDRMISDILKRFGAEVTFSGGSVTAIGGRLKATQIDASNTPDLVPVLAVIASVAEGKTVIFNARRLRIKESDRLDTITKMLRALGAEVEEQPDGLTITGKESLEGGEVSSFGDHRIAMAAAIASCVCRDDVIIKGAEAVDKSYPGFFRDFKALGGSLKEVF